MLRPPVNIVGSDFKQHRLAAADPKVIGEYESLITEWMTTIEGIVSDNDDRFLKLFNFLSFIIKYIY